MVKEGREESFVQDQTRLFTSMGKNLCPLGCIYCFVNAEGYIRPGRVDTAEAVQELSRIEEDGDIKTIVPAHDVEIFLVEDWAAKLMQLADFGLHIVIATKLSLEKGMPPTGKQRIDQLKAINTSLMEKGALLHLGVSITRLDEEKTREIEPYPSTPTQRIATVKALSEARLPVNIAIRPTLPFVPKEEFEELIARTAPYCESYLVSPLYLTPAMKVYLDREHPGYRVDLFKPSFMKGGIVETVNTDKTISMIREIADRPEYNRLVFMTSAPAIKHALALRGM